LNVGVGLRTTTQRLPEDATIAAQRSAPTFKLFLKTEIWPKP
jgi:hypothetical protein